MLIRTCTLAIVLTTCLGASAPRSNAAEGSSKQSGRSPELSGQPAWFPLGGEVYDSQDRFEAQRTLLAFRPQPRWFVGLVREPGPLEEKAAKEITASAHAKQDAQLLRAAPIRSKVRH